MKSLLSLKFVKIINQDEFITTEDVDVMIIKMKIRGLMKLLLLIKDLLIWKRLSMNPRNKF
jgi:hypothetical protein